MEPRKSDESLGINRRIARRLVSMYYGRIEVSDRDRLPQTGPVLICANHANSLIDPVLVGIAAGRPVRFMAKAPMFEAPVIGSLMRALGMVPAYRGSDDQKQVRRNLESLDVGAKVLGGGDAMGIFPEGLSHDLTTVEMVRSGAARMALQAAAEGAEGLQVVPVGLNYERKDEFRSAIWIRIGEPIDVGQILAEHDGNQRKARHALTRQLEQGLRTTVIHLDDAAWEPFLDDLEILVPDPGPVTRDTVFPLKRRKWLADSMNHVLREDRPKAEQVAVAIRTYREHVREAGVAIDSAVLRSSGWRMAATLAWRSVWMFVLLMRSLLGTLFHIVPFTIVRVAAAKLHKTGRTKVSLYRLLVGLPVYGLWYLAAGWWLFYEFHATRWFAWTVLLLMPILGVLSLSYWRTTRVTLALWWHQFRFAFHRDQLLKLRTERDELSSQLSTLADECHEISPRPTPPPKRSRKVLLRRTAMTVATLAVLGAAVWFIPRLFFQQPLVVTGFDLATLSERQLHVEMERDEKSLATIMAGLDNLEGRAKQIQEEFAAGDRDYTSEEDNEAVRHLMLGYINYRTALIRLIWKYLNYRDVESERDQLRAFLLDYTAAMVLCEASMKFVNNFTRDEQRHKTAIARMNTGEREWGIPDGLYDTIERNLANPANIQQLAAAGEYYKRSKTAFDKHELLESSQHAPFHTRIKRAAGTINLIGDGVLTEIDLSSKELITLVASTKYDGQSAISTWIGDFKVSERRDGTSLIKPKFVAQLRPLLEPGDILIERRNWYVSNAFLPGYWPHAAVYVGTVAQLKALGIGEAEIGAKHWKEFTQLDHDGHRHMIIEAVSEGVLFSSLEHSIGGGDSAAVFRPQLTDKQIKEAIILAFTLVGREYDFEFDFATPLKLVCTEVVYRTYGANEDETGIRFPTVQIMGRETMPAIELMRKYEKELGSDDAQLELIAFIDGNELTGRTKFYSGKDAIEPFLATIDRSGFTYRPGYLGWVLLALIVVFTIGNLAYYARKQRPRVR